MGSRTRAVVVVGLAVMVMVMGLAAEVAAQEVPVVPQCSNARPCVIEWNPNTEEDMAAYHVFLTRTQGVYPSDVPPVAVIPHPTAQETTVSLGELQDGAYFMAIKAVDTAGNLSGFSNEVRFDFDAPPGRPTITIRVP